MIKRKLLVGCCLTIGLMLAGCGDKEVSNQSATTTQVETTTEAETTTEVETTTEEETSTEEEVTTGVEDETTEAPTEPVTEEPTESVTEAVKPTEAPTQKPTEAPTTKPVETQPPTQAPTEAPTTEAVVDELPVIPQGTKTDPFDTLEDDIKYSFLPADEASLAEWGYVDYELSDYEYLTPYLLGVGTSSGKWIATVTTYGAAGEYTWEEAKEIIYSYDIDWNEQAYKTAVTRWGTADGYDEAKVHYFLTDLGFNEEEASYGASKWAENPPYETEIDWFEEAHKRAECLDSGWSNERAQSYIRSNNFTWDEVLYAMQFYKG